MDINNLIISDEEENRRKNVAYYGKSLTKDGALLASYLRMNGLKPPKQRGNKITGGLISPERAKNLSWSKNITDEEFKVIYDDYAMNYEAIVESRKDIYHPPPQNINDDDDFGYKLNCLIKKHIVEKTCFSFKQFRKYVKDWKKGKDEKTLFDWYNDYVKEIHQDPNYGLKLFHNNDISYTVYRSPNKRAHLQTLNINFGNADAEQINEMKNEVRNQVNEETENENEDKPTNYFPLKDNKQFHLHKVSSPNSYMIDLMQSGKFMYLIAININTRYLFAECMNNSVNFYLNDTEKQDIFSKSSKTASSFLNCLTKMMKNGMKPEFLTGDGEKAFASDAAKNFYRSNGITWIDIRRQKRGVYEDFYYNDRNQVKNVSKDKNRTDPLHSSLGIIDRVIRTLRDMAYNSEIGVIEPSDMKQLVELYNNAPHQSLSYYAGCSVTPNKVQHDSDLETFIMRRICQENYNVQQKEGFFIKFDQPVKVYNEKDAFHKRRSIIQPGIFYVQDFNNGLYTIFRPDTGDVQTVPRFKIAPAYVRKYRI